MKSFLSTIFLSLLFGAQLCAQHDFIPPPVECPYPLPPEKEDVAVIASPDTTVYTFCDEMPHFPGGDSAWRAYVQGAIRYPVIARDSMQEGTVYVQFTVETDGSITNCFVRKHPRSLSLAAEALRVVCNSPKWIPGTMNGKAVRVQMIMPIRFKL
jgi:TonB family protein